MSISATQPIPEWLDFRDNEKPYVENIAGRLEPKVSPKRIDSRLQLRIGRMLDEWAGDRGETGTEWRVYLLDQAGRESSLVPDIAYFSFARVPRSLPKDARERPRIAPDIAVEIWSPTQPIPNSLDFSDVEKPYVENISGRLEPKVSPKLAHGVLQGRLWSVLDEWAGDRGETATELRVYLLRPDGSGSSLVPDVAYFSFERLPRSLPEDARERLRRAPDIAVEIWSPRDSRKTLEEKIALYLAHGATVVIVIYPELRQIVMHRENGVETCAAVGVVAVAPYSDLAIDSNKLFRDL